MSEGCIEVPLERYPGMSRFVLDWLRGDTRFLERQRGAPAPSPAREVPKPLLDALVESNRRWGSNVAGELRQWAAGGTVTIITGQQVGVAGGPLYTLVKIASAVRWKRELAAKGQRATIFFWLASEDHDYGEAATVHMPARAPDRQLDLVTLRPPHITDARAAVGPLPVPEALIEELVAVLEVPRPSWLREGITFTDSFAELFVSALDGESIVYVDSLLPELRRAGVPFFESLMNRWTGVQQALASRSSELRNAGYAPQVVPREDGAYTLLFRLGEHLQRTMIEKPEPAGDPATLSTSAITRPLLQDSVLRPDIFIGGPGEVSYYAQIAPLYDLFSITMPRIALRGHVLVAPRRVLRAVMRYGLDAEDAFRPADEVLAEREAPGVAEVKAIAGRAKKNLAEEIARIGEIALPAEHSLARAINRSIGHLEYHFGKLTERAIRGLARKDRERYAAVRELVATLHPDGHVQDRIVNWFALWTQYGDALLPAIIDAVRADDDKFRIVGL